MLFPKSGPTPPTWRILLYCVLAVLLLVALGWFNTHVLGDHTQYPGGSSAVSQTQNS